MNENTHPRSLAVGVIASTVLVLPLFILELVNNPDIAGGFPVVLFIVLWLLPVFLIAGGGPLLRSRSRVVIAAAAAVMIVLAVFWVGLVADQLPCFLGVPNCD